MRCAFSGSYVRRQSIGLVVLTSLSGCISAPVIPERAFPIVLQPEIFSYDTPARAHLDCLSDQLADHKDTTFRVFLADIPNRVAPQIGDVNLPQSMRAQVAESLGRITDGFKLYDSEGLHGFDGISVGVNQVLPGIPAHMSVDMLAAHIVKPHITITGALHMAQVSRSGEIDTELFGLGIGGVVKVFDASLQLNAVNSQTRVYMTAPVSLQVRIYAAEQGASAFVLTGDNFSRGKAQFVQSAPTTYALQYLADYAAATLIREIAVANFNLNFSECERATDWQQAGRVVDKSSKKKPDLPVRVSIEQNGNQICVQFKTNHKRIRLDDVVKISIKQYRGYGILTEPINVERVQSTILNGRICIPPEVIRRGTDSMEVQVENISGNLLGAGRANISG